MPQNRFATIHVVGSNGKSSVSVLTAALLAGEGMASGVYLSPHLDRWSERIRVRGAEIGADDFGDAVARTAEAAAIAERGFEPGERVTQFEAATAAAFQALAGAGVDVGVIEAGLGGRLDATNVIGSKVTAVTSISLEHTDLLGESVEEIAAEKLAVLRAHSTLVLGPVDAAVASLAERTARGLQANVVRVDAADPRAASLPDGYPRINFSVALAAAEAFLGRRIDSAGAERVAASVRLPARLEIVDSDPPMILDAAHNPAGAAAIAEALPELSRGRPVIAVLAVLADKPAEGICAPIAAISAVVICTEIPAPALEGVGRPGARSHPAAELAVACGASTTEIAADPNAALDRARALARERGGIVLVAGSFYLLASLREPS